MGKYFDMLMEDVRMKEGLTACMNCGICTGVCPAAEFYDYDPRQIVNTVQTKDDDAIEQLLKSETIWYCGECMSCRPRCPRANTPGYIIQALRRLSQKLGFFTYSEKDGSSWPSNARSGTTPQNRLLHQAEPGRPELHPNKAPSGSGFTNTTATYSNASATTTAKWASAQCAKSTTRAWRRSRAIFDTTGGTDFFENIEKYSAEKATEMGYDGADERYFRDVFTANSGSHQ